RALADAAFSGADREHVPDAGEAPRDLRVLRLDLLDDARSAVAGDVEVALHTLLQLSAVRDLYGLRRRTATRSDGLHLAHDVQAIGHLTEHDMLAVEPRGL